MRSLRNKSVKNVRNLQHENQNGNAHCRKFIVFIAERKICRHLGEMANRQNIPKNKRLERAQKKF